jgi:hypothetical protein
MAVGQKEFMDQNYPQDQHKIVSLVEKNLVVPKADLQQFIDKLNEDIARMIEGKVGFRKEGNVTAEVLCAYRQNTLSLIVLDLQEILRNNTLPSSDECCSCHIAPPCDFCIRGGSLPESEK